MEITTCVGYEKHGTNETDDGYEGDATYATYGVSIVV